MLEGVFARSVLRRVEVSKEIFARKGFARGVSTRIYQDMSGIPNTYRSLYLLTCNSTSLFHITTGYELQEIQIITSLVP